MSIKGVEANHFSLIDPDAPYEDEFEAVVCNALPLAFGGYRCVPFRGTFNHDGHLFQPDLALVADDFSHWFIIEVELVSHSLDHHVLPQVRAFQYGKPQEDCERSLSRTLAIPIDQIRTFIQFVPRSVAVVANNHNPLWEQSFRGLGVQMLTVHAFESETGGRAFLIDGVLSVLMEHLGFGTYSAPDRSIRFASSSIRLPDGLVQIIDQSVGLSNWIVRRTEESLWLTKERGWPNIPNETRVQLVKNIGGRLSFRYPQ